MTRGPKNERNLMEGGVMEGGVGPEEEKRGILNILA